MTVSVIIPVYNVEKYLRECLDSVVSQTHGDLDIILVDDGSTDGSPAICDEYARRDARIRVLHCENGGPSVARNIGIDTAAGEYLLFIDSDDLVHREMIERLLRELVNSNSDIASCGWQRGSAPKLRTHNKAVSNSFDAETALERILFQRSKAIPSPWGHIFKKSLFGNGIRFIPGIIYEDLDAVPRIFEKAKRVVEIPDVLYFYRYTPTSLINTWSPRRLDVLDVTEKLENHFRDNPRLYAAARDRRLSAAFNILMLNARQGAAADPQVTDRCYKILKERRRDSLFNQKVRFKNKAGILASYLGRNFLTLLSKL